MWHRRTTALIALTVAAVFLVSVIAMLAKHGRTQIERREVRQNEKGLPLMLTALKTIGLTVYYHRRSVGNGAWVVEGKVEAYDEDGSKVLDGEYRNGLEHGVFRWWHNGGKPAGKQCFLDGYQQGAEIWWNEEGAMVHRKTFMDSRKHGPEEFWSADGKIEGRIEWYEGNPMEVVTYENGQEKERVVGPQLKDFLLEHNLFSKGRGNTEGGE